MKVTMILTIDNPQFRGAYLSLRLVKIEAGKNLKAAMFAYSNNFNAPVEFFKAENFVKKSAHCQIDLECFSSRIPGGRKPYLKVENFSTFIC